MNKNDSFQEASKLFEQGKTLCEQKHYAEAIQKFEAAKAICLQLNNFAGLGDIEREIGVALFRSDKPEEAIPHYDLALEFFEKIASSLEFFEKIAPFSYGTGNMTKYAEMMDKIGTVQMKKGFAMRNLGKHAEAIDCFERAKSGFDTIHNATQAANMEMNIGLDLRNSDKAREALNHFKVAKAIFEKLEAPPEEQLGHANLEIGTTQFVLSEYGDALSHFKDAKTIFEKLNKWYWVAKTNTGVADTLSVIGKYEDALNYYDTASQQLKSLPVSEDVTDRILGVAIGKGNTLQSMKQYEKALEQYEIAKVAAENLGDSKQQALADINMDIGNTLSLMNRIDEASSYYDAARTFFVKQDYKQRIAEIDNNIGNNLNEQKRYAEAKQKFEEAIEICGEFGLVETQSEACAGLAESFNCLGDPIHSLAYVTTSIKLMEWVRAGIKSPELQRKIREKYLQRMDFVGDVHLTLLDHGGTHKNLDAAFNAFELSKCATLAESLEMGGAGVSCPEMGELVKKEDHWLNMLQQDYSKLEKLTKLRGSDKIDATTFRGSYTNWQKKYDENYKEIEKLRSELLLQCADAGSTPIPRDYEVLEKALKAFPKDKKWCVLEYVFSIASNKWIVFIVNQSGLINFERLPSGTKDIEKQARRCRDVIGAVRDGTWGRQKADNELNELSKDLYPTLVPEKTHEALKKADVEYLMVVPHGVLHWVPFEALYDGNEFWGTKYVLSTNFSLDVGRLCVEKRLKKTTGFVEHPAFLLVQNPLGDLEGANNEINEVKELLKAKQIDQTTLHREEATEQAFIDAVNSLPLTVLHHCGHAQFMGKNPSLSYLKLHANDGCQAKECGGKEATHKPELLNATEIIHKIKFKGAPIVYLAACETGISGVEPGEEAFGLLRALMYAGATSLISSRWLLSDPIGPVFAKEFYQQMLDGSSAAIALRNARRTVFEKAPLKYTDWAAFFLSGDPFRTIAQPKLSV